MDERTVITIGREFGSGGREIGHESGREDLGIKLLRQGTACNVRLRRVGSAKNYFEISGREAYEQFPLFSCNGYLFSGIFIRKSYADMPINHKVFPCTV